MAKINYRFNEWLKKVDKSEAEVKSKKAQSVVSEAPTDTTAPVSVVVPNAEIGAINISDTPVKSATAHVRVATKSAGTAVAERPKTMTSDEVTKHIEHKPAPKPTYQAKVALDIEQTEKIEGKLLLTPEGTGDPRPISANGQPVIMPKALEIEELLEHTEPRERKITKAEPKPELKPEPREAVTDLTSTQENWSRLPHHLQVLFSSPDSEVAQRSYKTFRDTRAQLIEKLLDPPLTLEETARILNVCPTTVRRYTNSDQLKHYRTAGNQRRFRLSDVLGFMEQNNKTAKKSSSKRKPRGEE